MKFHRIEGLSASRAAAREIVEQRVEAAKAATLRAIDTARTDEQLDDIVGAFTHGVDTLPTTADLGNVLADRIGPVWTLKGAASRMPGQGAKPLHPERLRQRINDRTLVGLFTRDRRWVVPAWQLRRSEGSLEIRDDVVALWQLLPHDVDRASGWTHAAWIRSPLRSLDGETPLSWLDRHGLDESLVAAAGRVRARLAA